MDLSTSTCELQPTMLKHKVSNVVTHYTPSVNQDCSPSEITFEGMCVQSATDRPSLDIQLANDSTQKTEIDSKNGLQRITEKYDSISNVLRSPQRSPIGSIASDGGSFTFTDLVNLQKFQEGVTETDLLQVDTFYRSHKSEVHVCGCLANLYYGSLKAAYSNDQWVFSCTGIPLLLLDTGEHHRERKLYLLLAEKGTGFTLWRETIDNLTNYKTPNVNFHTLHASKDHNKLAGLSFDDAKAASEFYSYFQKLISDPTDEVLKIGKSRKKVKVKDKKKKLKLPKKAEISKPCCFVHVTKLDRPAMEVETTNNKMQSGLNGISGPFNFHHVTAMPESENSQILLSANLSSMMGNKLTLTSTESADSVLSDDRNLVRAGN